MRGWLLPEFYYLFKVVPSKEPTRQERIRRLKKLREAATTLHALLTSFDALWWDLPLGLLDPNDLDASGVDEDLDASAGGRTRFVASLKLLADTAAGRIEELTAEQARKGRPAKNAPFRELTPRLVRQYERFTKQPAGPPNWIPNSGIWRGKGSFYPCDGCLVLPSRQPPGRGSCRNPIDRGRSSSRAKEALAEGRCE